MIVKASAKHHWSLLHATPTCYAVQNGLCRCKLQRHMSPEWAV